MDDGQNTKSWQSQTKCGAVYITVTFGWWSGGDGGGGDCWNSRGSSRHRFLLLLLAALSDTRQKSLLGAIFKRFRPLDDDGRDGQRMLTGFGGRRREKFFGRRQWRVHQSQLSARLSLQRLGCYILLDAAQRRDELLVPRRTTRVGGGSCAGRAVKRLRHRIGHQSETHRAGRLRRTGRRSGSFRGKRYGPRLDGRHADGDHFRPGNTSSRRGGGRFMRRHGDSRHRRRYRQFRERV